MNLKLLSQTLLTMWIASATSSTWGASSKARKPASKEDAAPPLSYLIRSNEPHDFRVMNDGIAALELRLQLIERAEKSIDVETYILAPLDLSTRLITQALVRKADQGVLVRLLIDKTAREKEMIALAHEFAKHGIETRVYNTPKIHFLWRDHRKNILVDRKEVITGGRNLTDEYFFTNTQYAHLDHDVYLRGELVPRIADIYDAFWFDPESRPLPLNIPRYDKKIAANRPSLEKSIHAMIEPSEDDKSLRAKVRAAAAAPSNPLGVIATTCHNITYVSDAPGIKREARFTSLEILERMSKCEGELLYETPVFLISDRSALVFDELLAKGVHITAFTNGLQSANRGTVSFVNSEALVWAQKPNFKVYVNMQAPLDPIFGEQHKPDAFTLHAKGMVCGKDSIMIGSYNFDPRSEDLNTEMAVFCDGNQKLTADLKAAMLAWAKNSPELSKDPGAFKRGAPISKQLALPVMGPILRRTPLRNQY